MPDWLIYKRLELADKDNRVMISVPKSVIANATGRNRIRRLLREAVRSNPAFRKPYGQHRFIIRKNPGALKLADVARALQQLEL